MKQQAVDGHLTESQREMVAARLANMQQGRRTDLELPENLPEVSQERAAHSLGVSERLVRHAKSVQTTGVPELAKAVDSGEIAISTAADLSRLPADNSSKTRDIVLDSFGGSGTTLIACEKSGRRARLMELDPKYVDVICRRFQNYSGEEAKRASDGAKFVEMVKPELSGA